MLRDAFFLARQDLRFLFRERATWTWAFVMPVISSSYDVLSTPHWFSSFARRRNC
jgi:hypothetical protein